MCKIIGVWLYRFTSEFRTFPAALLAAASGRCLSVRLTRGFKLECCFSINKVFIIALLLELQKLDFCLKELPSMLLENSKLYCPPNRLVFCHNWTHSSNWFKPRLLNLSGHLVMLNPLFQLFRFIPGCPENKLVPLYLPTLSIQLVCTCSTNIPKICDEKLKSVTNSQETSLNYPVGLWRSLSLIICINLPKINCSCGVLPCLDC